jgi:hypothetical protein
VSLHKIEARNAAGDLHTFEFADISDGFLLADVEGLDPVKATLVSSSFAALPGEEFHRAKREPRNITIKIELRPDFVTTSVEDLRDQLYDFFMPQSQIFLRLYRESGLTVDISGYVETCETAIFSQEPTVDISMMFFQPDFIDVDTVTIEGDTVSDSTETTVEYAGSIDTGIVFTLAVDRAETDFTIYHRAPDGTVRQLDFAYAMVSGDSLVISTVPGDKRATLTRSGTATSVLNSVTPQSNWISLRKGTNTLRVFTSGAGIPFTVQYMNRYGGL